MELNRAYSLLEVKAVDDDQRIIEGVATTPSPDRMNDVVMSEGVEFSLPLPLLWQHDSRNPIGKVLEAEVREKGIRIRAQLAAAGVDPDVDRAWTKIKAKLVQGLSIGFRSLEEAWDKTTNGFRFLRTEWLELSVVTIPANAEATITAVKSACQSSPVLPNRNASRVVRLDTSRTPAAVGSTNGKDAMTLTEQIAALEEKRQASDKEMEAIMQKAADEGRTLEDDEKEAFDNLKGEVREIEEHLARLRPLAEKAKASATPVDGSATPADDGDPGQAVAAAQAAGQPKTDGAAARSGAVQTVRVQPNQPKGTAFARAVIALTASKGLPHVAEGLAKQHYPDNPEVAFLCRYMSDERFAIHSMMMKELQDPGTTTGTTWASPLVPNAQQLVDEFLELLRPATIIGRIPSLNRVPFNVAVPRQTGDGTFGWVGEGAAKPVGQFAYDSVTLRWAKAAGIVALTKELVKFSSPSAEQLVRREMINGLTRFLDVQFVDHNVTAVANVSPAGITQGLTAITPSGTTAAAFRADMMNAFNNMTAANEDPTDFVILMTASQALALSLLVNTLGQPEFPDISMNGGRILGLPLVISENVGALAAGGRSERIIIVNPANVLLAEEGLMLDASEQASIEMDTNPTEGTSPAEPVRLVSLWQRNLIGIRVERFIIWARGRETSVQFISGNNYGGATSP